MPEFEVSLLPSWAPESSEALRWSGHRDYPTILPVERGQWGPDNPWGAINAQRDQGSELTC